MLLDNKEENYIQDADRTRATAVYLDTILAFLVDDNIGCSLLSKQISSEKLAGVVFNNYIIFRRSRKLVIFILTNYFD